MTGGVWAPALLGRVFAVVDAVVATGAEADAALLASSGPRLHLSEPLAASADVYSLRLPGDDERALPALRRHGSPAGELGAGVVGVLPDGRLALGVGGGRAIESIGECLAVVSDPGPGRYIELWEIPGAVYL